MRIQYSININQLAIVNHNNRFGTNLDIIDGVILEYLQKQSTSTFAKRNFKIVDGAIFYLLCYDNIIQQLPLIKIASKDSICRRIDKLLNANVILKHIEKIPNNGTKIYFTTTEIFESFFSYHTTQKSDGDATQKSDGDATQKSDGDATQKSDELIYDNIINDNNINDKDTASGFSFQGSYLEIPNYSTNFNSVELHQIKKSAVKENLTTQKQDGQQNYILNTSKKSGAQHGTSTAVKPCILSKNNATNGVDIDGPAQDQHCGKNADFNEFWKEFCNMCKAKGSTAGEKKPAETEYKKAVKIANHQGIMRTLEAFKDFILLAFENNKHACRWLKNIHWPDFENVIADYKQQTEILKTNLKKQGKPLPIAQKSPEKQQEEVKMKEHIQERRKSVIKHLNGDEVKFMNHIKEVLKSYFQELHKPWIDDFVFSCKDRVAYFGFTEQKHIDTVKRNFEKFEQIITREIASTDLVKEGENLKIELKLID